MVQMVSRTGRGLTIEQRGDSDELILTAYGKRGGFLASANLCDWELCVLLKGLEPDRVVRWGKSKCYVTVVNDFVQFVFVGARGSVKVCLTVDTVVARESIGGVLC